jgi:isocitrate dehydrogenase (NAD+)
MSARVIVIEGDGVGPEVVRATLRVLDATGIAFEWERHVVGEQAYRRTGTALPAAVVDAIRESGVALKGPTATPVGAPFASVNVALRRELDLYTGIRPSRAFDGVAGARAGTDLVVIRMNHQDLYAGLGYAPGEPATAKLLNRVSQDLGVRFGADTGLSLKPISRSEALRVSRAAMRFAERHGRSRVTVVHKANVMPETDGVFLAAAREAAQDHPLLHVDDLLVDSACADLVRRPAEHDVMLLPTLYGDIVSDIAGALVGGLGLAPGANLGDGCAVFEPVHGVVSKHAGRDRVNPIATVLSGAMLLGHLGHTEAAARVGDAVEHVIRDGTTLTYDLADGRPAGTSAVADAIVARLEGGDGA